MGPLITVTESKYYKINTIKYEFNSVPSASVEFSMFFVLEKDKNRKSNKICDLTKTKTKTKCNKTINY